MAEQLSFFFDLDMAAIDWSDINFVSSTSIKLTEQRSFAQGNSSLTMGNGEPWVIFATIGKIDSKTVYLKSWYCYEFVYTFKSSTAAERFFKEKLDALTTCTPNGKHGWINEIENHPLPVDIYRCPDGTLSCKEYYDNRVNLPYQQEFANN